ncbi:MAG: hypothetical protein ACE5EK_09860 [Nitrospinales bacterium]
MAEKENENNEDEHDLEEIVVSTMLGLEAIINVLEKKGVFTREEILEEMQKLEDGDDE